SARCVGDIVTCTSFSASTNVSTETSCPTGGAVPNAGGAPGVGAVCGVCPPATASPATTAQINPIELCARNSRRERPIRLPLTSNPSTANTARYSTHPPQLPLIPDPCPTPDPCSLIPDPCLTLTLMPLATLTLELAIEHAQSLKDR